MIHTVLKPKDYTVFDPTNVEHQKVVVDLLTKGRYPNDMRFVLEKPHTMIPTMLVTKLAEQFLQDQGLLQGKGFLRKEEVLRREGAWPV